MKRIMDGDPLVRADATYPPDVVATASPWPWSGCAAASSRASTRRSSRSASSWPASSSPRRTPRTTTFPNAVF